MALDEYCCPRVDGVQGARCPKGQHTGDGSVEMLGKRPVLSTAQGRPTSVRTGTGGRARPGVAHPVLVPYSRVGHHDHPVFQTETSAL